MKKTALIFLSILCLHKNVMQAQTLTATNCNPVFGDAFTIKYGDYNNPFASGSGQVGILVKLFY
jgi:hypothetical protein